MLTSEHKCNSISSDNPKRIMWDFEERVAREIKISNNATRTRCLKQSGAIMILIN
jgi:hypothetical protein